MKVRLVPAFAIVALGLLISWAFQTPTADAAADQVFLSQTCSTAFPGRASATLSWTGNDPSALHQLVDLSLANNGWQQGTYSSSGMLPATSSAVLWDGLESSTLHFARVSQQLANGVRESSATYFFTSTSCAALPSPASFALSQLATLVMQDPAPMTGYSRSHFGPAWADVDGNGCDTRNDILMRDLVAIMLRTGSACIVETGILEDPYTGDTISFVRGVGTSNAVQIDHVVALAAAWRTGAAEWSPTKRLQFANDPEHLLAVDGPTNSAKGDKDAAQWLPPEADFHCAYVIMQVAIKVKYTLRVTPSEQGALTDVLSNC